MWKIKQYMKVGVFVNESYYRFGKRQKTENT